MPSSSADPFSDALRAVGLFDDRIAAIRREVAAATPTGTRATAIVDAAHAALRALSDAGQAPHALTPRMVLDRLRAHRPDPGPEGDCVGCDDGVVRMLSWSDGYVDAFACACALGRRRSPPLRSVLGVFGTHRSDDAVLRACYDWARTRTDPGSLRHFVEELVGLFGGLRAGAVRAALTGIPSGSVPELAWLRSRAVDAQARLDASWEASA